MTGRIRLRLKQYEQCPLIKIQFTSTRVEDGQDILVVVLDVIREAIKNYNGMIAYVKDDFQNLPELHDNDEYGIAVHLLFETEAEVDKFVLDYVNSKF